MVSYVPKDVLLFRHALIPLAFGHSAAGVPSVRRSEVMAYGVNVARGNVAVDPLYE